MIARISTYFDCTEEKLWKKIIEPKSLQFVTSPILSFKPFVEGELDGEWVIGKAYELKLYFLNVLPLGRHRIKIITIDRESNTIVSTESGTLAPTWNHTIRFGQCEQNKLIYTDEIEIKGRVANNGYLGICTAVLSSSSKTLENATEIICDSAEKRSSSHRPYLKFVWFWLVQVSTLPMKFLYIEQELSTGLTRFFPHPVNPVNLVKNLFGSGLSRLGKSKRRRNAQPNARNTGNKRSLRHFCYQRGLEYQNSP